MEEGEVHFWRLVGSDSDAETLPAEEKHRHDQMADPVVRRDFATSQAALRRVLARYRQCEPGEIRLARHKRGKPYVVGGPEFNLSHTGGGIFLAVSRAAIGLDVEKRDRTVSAVALAGNFFTPAEQARIVGADPETARERFLRHWVCKEAMVKLSGDGIYHGLRNAEVTAPGRGIYRGRDVWLHEGELPDGYFVALAAWRPFRVKFFFPS